MAKRQSSFTVPSNQISRNIDDSTYDIIKLIWSNIDSIISVGANVDNVKILLSLDLPAVTKAATYIHQAGVVYDESQAIKDVATEINLGINSAILNAATNAQVAIESAASSEVNAKICSESALLALVAVASRKTAESYAVEPINVFVKVYTSNGDGSYTITTTTNYSALHWYNKSEGNNNNVLLERTEDSEAAHLQDAIRDITLAEQMGINKSRINQVQYSRIGELVKTTGAIPFADCVKANGSLLLRSEFPELWVFAQDSGNIVSEEEWKLHTVLGYSFGDDSTTFRVPDWRGQYNGAVLFCIKYK